MRTLDALRAILASDLPTNERMVAVVYASCVNEQGTAWPGVARLQRETGLSDSSVRRARAALRARGFLRPVRNEHGGSSSTVYVLDLAPLSDGTPCQSATPVRETGGPCHSDRGTPVTQTPDPEREPEREPDTLPQPPHGGSTSEASEAPAEPAPAGLGALGLPGRLVAALEASGLRTVDAVAALTDQELRRRPGIGARSVESIAAALEGLGLELRREAKVADGRALAPRARLLTDVWAAGWRHAHGEAPPWSLAPGSPDRRHVDRWPDVAGVPEDADEGHARVRRFRVAVWKYLDAVRDGKAWPQGEPASVARFSATLGDWLQVADGWEARRGATSPADFEADAEEDWGAALRAYSAHGPRVLTMRLHDDEGRGAAVRAALRAVTLQALGRSQRDVHFEVRPRFVAAYCEARRLATTTTTPPRLAVVGGTT